MTDEQALAEAKRRWGDGGAIRSLPPRDGGREGARGRLARYRYTVGNSKLGKHCSIKGQGDTWRAAFDDAAAGL